ncbi:hypothetical protein DUNSADRAFT_3918 [Dunaliella salina]|uniref:CBS domain-containing protein n=1 Tax=Dunaliella salina TaxID=3046 RepID=A0ABQ7FV35_DUNSA|nr:hypothetical protein DUNSADRAFT_3918 [Dunaliella salina]|eukprot:KAF5826255.1 hypothetical protein DUNSADRAFT_3918 [Dunaliella salina]
MPTVFTGARLDTVPADISFSALVSKMASEKIHRVYVPAADGSAQSIITLTDVLRVVSGSSLPKARRSLDLQIEWDNKRREQLRAEGKEPMEA